VRSGDCRGFPQLIELCSPRRGCPGIWRKAAYRVDYASEIEQEWLVGVETIGISSGASVPEILVDHALADLAGAGFGEVKRCARQKKTFSSRFPKSCAGTQAAK